MNPILSFLLWLILTLTGTLISFLPRSLEIKLGKALGRFLLWIGGSRKRIAKENISLCMPEISALERRRLLKENFEHYGILALELLHMFSPIPGHYLAYVRKIASVDGLENWQKAHERGKGVLFVSAHLANWEIMAIIAALRGVPVTIITRQIKPAWLDKKITSLRASAGCGSAYKEQRLTAVLKGLRNQQSIGFVLDQYIAPPAGIYVKFFTAQVHTLGVLGLFSKRAQAPIVPVFQTRDEKGIIHVVFEPAISPEEIPDDPKEFTQALSLKVEGWIRKNPAQWLWVHRRFKNAIWDNPTAVVKTVNS